MKKKTRILIDALQQQIEIKKIEIEEISKHIDELMAQS